MLGRRIQAREPHVQNIRQLEAALHREWQQLSQQDIRRLTGGACFIALYTQRQILNTPMLFLNDE
jgi:hypothetical protein